MTLTNINFTPQNKLLRSAWTGPPARLASPKLALAGTPAQPCFAPLQEKQTSGTNLKLRFVNFIRFVGFNFGHVQLLRFVVVMVWTYSFGHLDSVKWITLISFHIIKLSSQCFKLCFLLIGSATHVARFVYLFQILFWFHKKFWM